jgi:hypothetical protein
MLRHLIDVHEEEEDQWASIRFGMKILKNTRTAFERQILESVLIQKARKNNIMNNKAEYNRCALPRLTAKLGEKDLDKWREEDRREMEKEATIEEKIRIRKKEKAKKRGAANRRMEHGQPMQKKRRVEANDSIPEEEGRGRKDLRQDEGGEEEEENKGQEDKVNNPNITIKITKEEKSHEGRQNNIKESKEEHGHQEVHYLQEMAKGRGREG